MTYYEGIIELKVELQGESIWEFKTELDCIADSIMERMPSGEPLQIDSTRVTYAGGPN